MATRWTDSLLPDRLPTHGDLSDIGLLSFKVHAVTLLRTFAGLQMIVE